MIFHTQISVVFDRAVHILPEHSERAEFPAYPLPYGLGT